MKIKLLNENAIAPKKATTGAAGRDLAIYERINISPQSDCLVPLGYAIELPVGTVGQIWPRSSLDFKWKLTTGAGIIDQDYRGELKVLLRNLGDETIILEPGERIAQLVILQLSSITMVEICTNLETTIRNEGGFGSTGK